jgi:hypothetical protein
MVSKTISGEEAIAPNRSALMIAPMEESEATCSVLKCHVSLDAC